MNLPKTIVLALKLLKILQHTKYNFNKEKFKLAQLYKQSKTTNKKKSFLHSGTHDKTTQQ